MNETRMQLYILRKVNSAGRNSCNRKYHKINWTAPNFKIIPVVIVLVAQTCLLLRQSKLSQSTTNLGHASGLHLAGIEDLDKRRDLLSHKFFKSILQPTSCLHNLLPPSRDPELLSRLRAPSKYPRIANRSKKYQSFISYALAHYQQSQSVFLYIMYMYIAESNVFFIVFYVCAL